MMATNSLSFDLLFVHLSEKVCILPFILKVIFAGCRILS